MTATRRPSPQTVAVLTAPAADPSCWRYGTATADSAAVARWRHQLRGAW